MSFEIFLELCKYAWLPLLGFAYKEYKNSQDKQDKRLEKLEIKVAHQMTKEDVVEVVTNATNLLSAQIKLDLQKIDNGVHQIKNQNSGKDATIIELNHIMNDVSKLLKFLIDEKK